LCLPEKFSILDAGGEQIIGRLWHIRIASGHWHKLRSGLYDWTRRKGAQACVRIDKLIKENQKLEAIKAVKIATGTSLKNAKDYVDARADELR